MSAARNQIQLRCLSGLSPHRGRKWLDSGEERRWRKLSLAARRKLRGSQNRRATRLQELAGLIRREKNVTSARLAG
jgi:hypothetical protein